MDDIRIHAHPIKTTSKRRSTIQLPLLVVSAACVTLASILAFHLTARSTVTTPSYSPPPPQSRTSNGTWLSQFSSHPHTKRVGCREYDAGLQSCVFQGLACINTSANLLFTKPLVYLVDDTRKAHDLHPDDDWCDLGIRASDPRHHSGRRWPIKRGKVAPHGSCLRAELRTFKSLKLSKRVKWHSNLWLVNLDYVKNNHNNHLLKNIVWILDVILWQDSVDVQGTSLRPNPELLFNSAKRHIYLPQGRDDFIEQTLRDVNRLLYALVLQLDPKRLYPNQTYEEMHSPPSNRRMTAPLLEAYPKLEKRLVFHKELLSNNSTDLVCTPRLTVGSYLPNVGHERVCRKMREVAFKFFNVPRPEMKWLGQIRYPQPPRRVLILHRHISRKLGNLKELEKGLREAFEKYEVEIEVVTTAHLVTAEEWVRVFSRAGVLISSHGSQNMGQIFMQRHAALIEIMPFGYTDYSFNLLSETCKIWYYELQGLLGDRDHQEYVQKCGSVNKVSQILDPCPAVKSMDVIADVPEVVKTARFALQRIGYVFGDGI